MCDRAKIRKLAIHTRVGVATICIVMVVAACNTRTVKPGNISVSDLCDFDRNWPREVVATLRLDGTVVHGKVTNNAILREYPSIFAAHARPQGDRIIETDYGWGFCCKSNYYGAMWCTNYPDCEKTTKYDLKGIYAIARASDEKDARRLALETCEAQTERFSDSHDLGYDSSLDCIIVGFDSCY